MSDYEGLFARLRDLASGSIAANNTCSTAINVITALEDKVEKLEAKMKRWKTTMNVSYGEALR